MRIFNRVAAGTSIATLLLAVTPMVSLASPVEADMSQGIAEFPRSVSTSGSPYIAAMLNVGTAQSMTLRQAALLDPTGVEVAGVQLEGGVTMSSSVSTLGNPMQAALLNAGTAYSVAIKRGDVIP
jgi:hypothetical protein